MKTAVKTLGALLKLEYWEHRGAFVKTPMIIGLVLGVITILAYLTGDRFIVDLSGGNNLKLAISTLEQLSKAEITMGLDIFMLSTASLYHFVLFIVIFFFLLGSLYDDRKDGSILFYKSLPISDTQTVMSKLLTATVIAPVAFIFGLIVSHLFVFLILTVILLINGLNPLGLLWSNVSFVNNWGAFAIGCLVQALWALPLYGWLLFTSAVAKRRPFLMAVFAPLVAGFIWYWYNALVNLNLFKIGFFKTIGILFAKATTPFASGIGHTNAGSFNFNPNEQSNLDVINAMLNGLMKTELFYGIIFAVITVGLAVYIRRYRNTV